jgi:hypothetical protein
MASTKKDKGAAAPETSECGNCAASEGQNGITLKPCPKCKLASYCGRACQATQWKASHKQFCVAPGNRKPQASSQATLASAQGTQASHARDMRKDIEGSRAAGDDYNKYPICFAHWYIAKQPTKEWPPLSITLALCTRMTSEGHPERVGCARV